MKAKKQLAISLGLILALSLFSGCLGSEEEQPELSRIVEVDETNDNFPTVFVDNGDRFIFDYKITGAEFVDSISDSEFGKTITPEKGKFLVVKFTAVNRSRFEEYGNLPEFKVKYNGEELGAQVTASNAEEVNDGLRAYTTEKVKSARKGKYVKVFELTNYDESVQDFMFMINGIDGAKGTIDVNVAEMNKGKLSN